MGRCRPEKALWAVCHGSWSGPEFGDGDLCCWSSGDRGLSKLDLNGNTFEAVSDDHECLEIALWCDVVQCEVWQVVVVPNAAPTVVNRMSTWPNTRTAARAGDQGASDVKGRPENVPAINTSLAQNY